VSLQVRLDGYQWAAAATDLVNTAPEVMVSTGDALADPDALQRFLVEHDLRPGTLEPRPTAVDLAAMHGLRRRLRELIDTTDEVDAVARATAIATQAGIGPTRPTTAPADGPRKMNVGSPGTPDTDPRVAGAKPIPY
jgi:hypothetical protein